MAWRTEVAAILLVVIALAQGNFNVIGEWNMFGSLSRSNNSPNGGYQFLVKSPQAATPTPFSPRRDSLKTSLSGANLLQFSASGNKPPKSFSVAPPNPGSSHQQGSILADFQRQLANQKMILVDKHMGHVQIQPGSFTDKVVISNPSRALSYYSFSHRDTSTWQRPPSTRPPPTPRPVPVRINRVQAVTAPVIKPRYQFTMADGMTIRRGNLPRKFSRGPTTMEASSGLNLPRPMETLVDENTNFPLEKSPKTSVLMIGDDVIDAKNQLFRKQDNDRKLTFTKSHLTDNSRNYDSSYTNTLRKANIQTDYFSILESENLSQRRHKRQAKAVKWVPQHMKELHTVLKGNASVINAFAQNNRDRNRERIRDLKSKRKRKRKPEQQKIRKEESKAKSNGGRNKKNRGNRDKSKKDVKRGGKDDKINDKNDAKTKDVKTKDRDGRLKTSTGRRRTKPERRTIQPDLEEVGTPSVNTPSNFPDSKTPPTIETPAMKTTRQPNSETSQTTTLNLDVNLTENTDLVVKSTLKPNDGKEIDLNKNSDNDQPQRPTTDDTHEKVPSTASKVPRNIFIIIPKLRRDFSRARGRGVRHYSPNDRVRYRYIDEMIRRGHEMMRGLHFPSSNNRGRARQSVRSERRPGNSRTELVFPDRWRPHRRRNRVVTKRGANSANVTSDKKPDKAKHSNASEPESWKNIVNNIPEEKFRNTTDKNIYFVKTNEAKSIISQLKSILDLNKPIKYVDKSDKNKTSQSNVSDAKSNMTSGKKKHNVSNTPEQKKENKKELPLNSALNKNRKYFNKTSPKLSNGSEARKKRFNEDSSNYNKNTDKRIRKQTRTQYVVHPFFTFEHPSTKPFNPFADKKNPRTTKNVRKSYPKARKEKPTKQRKTINKTYGYKPSLDRANQTSDKEIKTEETIPPLKDRFKSKNTRNGQHFQPTTSTVGQISDRKIPLNNRNKVNHKPSFSDTEKNYDGSKGSGIRRDSDLAKVHFLETFKKINFHKKKSKQNDIEDGLLWLGNTGKKSLKSGRSPTSQRTSLNDGPIENKTTQTVEVNGISKKRVISKSKSPKRKKSEKRDPGSDNKIFSKELHNEVKRSNKSHDTDFQYPNSNNTRTPAPSNNIQETKINNINEEENQNKENNHAQAAYPQQFNKTSKSKHESRQNIEKSDSKPETPKSLLNKTAKHKRKTLKKSKLKSKRKRKRTKKKSMNIHSPFATNMHSPLLLDFFNNYMDKVSGSDNQETSNLKKNHKLYKNDSTSNATQVDEGFKTRKAKSKKNKSRKINNVDTTTKGTTNTVKDDKASSLIMNTEKSSNMKKTAKKNKLKTMAKIPVNAYLKRLRTRKEKKHRRRETKARKTQSMTSKQNRTKTSSTFSPNITTTSPIAVHGNTLNSSRKVPSSEINHSESHADSPATVNSRAVPDFPTERGKRKDITANATTPSPNNTFTSKGVPTLIPPTTLQPTSLSIIHNMISENNIIPNTTYISPSRSSSTTVTQHSRDSTQSNTLIHSSAAKSNIKSNSSTNDSSYNENVHRKLSKKEKDVPTVTNSRTSLGSVSSDKSRKSRSHSAGGETKWIQKSSISLYTPLKRNNNVNKTLTGSGSIPTTESSILPTSDTVSAKTVTESTNTVTDLPLVDITTTTNALSLTGVASILGRKLGINITLSRLAELRANLADQYMSTGGAQATGAAPPPNYGPPPGPIYPANQPANRPPPQYNHPPQQRWNPPPRHWNAPTQPPYPTHPPRYMVRPTPPPFYPPPRRMPPPRMTPKPATPKPTTTTTTTTTKKPEIEYDMEGPRTTQAPPQPRTRPTPRPKCDYWSMDNFGNLQFFPCQRPIFVAPTTTTQPPPVFYFYDVATPDPDPWGWSNSYSYDYSHPNKEVKIEVKVKKETKK